MGDRVWGTEEESGQLIRVEPHLQQTLWTSSFLDQGSVVLLSQANLIVFLIFGDQERPILSRGGPQQWCKIPVGCGGVNK